MATLPTIPTIAPVTLGELTTVSTDGTGVFDVLMQANKAHLEQEYKQNRIKGPEYSTVYLGSLQSVLGAAIQFLLQKDKVALEAQLVGMQVALAEKELEIKGIDLQIKGVELEIVQANLEKIPYEIQLLQAQVEKLQAEADKIPAEKALIEQQTTNAVQQRLNLIAEECKLKAEFDLLGESKLKTAEERNLLVWKTNTEKAQTTAAADPDSVIGKQKALYGAQTAGYSRDGEQKATQILVDAWKIQKSTDSDATDANDVNKLNDTHVGRSVAKLLSGINA